MLALLGFCGLAVCPASADDGFVSLFNGKDLSGWAPVGTPDAFHVEKGAILSTGVSPYPSWLRTERPYENFVLRFDYQTLGWYEGGILLHAPVDGPASKLGLQLHLRHDRLDYKARSPGAIYDVAAPKSLANFDSGKWNRCEITCDWPRLEVTLNGVKIQDLDMAANPSLRYRLRTGFIGLENIGCRAYFRNITIKPLPGQEEWTSLFSTGLNGLRFLGNSRWEVGNDTLSGQGPTGFALTKATFQGPFELQVWVKTCLNGNGGVTFNALGRSTGTEVQCFNCPDSTNPTGSLYDIAPADRIVSQDNQWFLLQIFVDGPNAMVLVNGEKVSETDQLKPPYHGAIGFQQHTPGGHIDYRGARIREGRWR
jgi:3-keto-disaccharide hydrolase